MLSRSSLLVIELGRIDPLFIGPFFVQEVEVLLACPLVVLVELYPLIKGDRHGDGLRETGVLDQVRPDLLFIGPDIINGLVQAGLELRSLLWPLLQELEKEGKGGTRNPSLQPQEGQGAFYQ